LANPSQNSRAAPTPSASHRILRKFAYLVSARWIREAFQTVFLIYLARHSSTTYGEFMLALGLGDILLLIGQFGLNLPLVSLLSKKDADRGGALTQVLALKTGLLACACVGVVAFVHWQSYSPA
jgi:O-antigen/teichoic acid export membrane protein